MPVLLVLTMIEYLHKFHIIWGFYIYMLVDMWSWQLKYFRSFAETMSEHFFIFQIFHISSLEAVNFLEKFLSMNPDPRYCWRLIYIIIRKLKWYSDFWNKGTVEKLFVLIVNHIFLLAVKQDCVYPKCKLMVRSFSQFHMFALGYAQPSPTLCPRLVLGICVILLKGEHKSFQICLLFVLVDFLHLIPR